MKILYLSLLSDLSPRCDLFIRPTVYPAMVIAAPPWSNHLQLLTVIICASFLLRLHSFSRNKIVRTLIPPSFHPSVLTIRVIDIDISYRIKDTWLLILTIICTFSDSKSVPVSIGVPLLPSDWRVKTWISFATETILFPLSVTVCCTYSPPQSHRPTPTE